MFLKVLFVIVYCVFVGGSGIFHENSKITFYPDDLLDSEYFGYSVLLNPYGLIVGAPKARHRDKHIASGLVFNCTLQQLDHKNVTCDPLEITGRDHYSDRLRKMMPDNLFKDDMWFGATLGGITDGKLLICAPRYTEPYSTKFLLSGGVCYIKKNNRDITAYPLSDKSRLAFKTDGLRREYGDYGQHLNYYAYGQSGMSVKVTGENHVIIGAPGLLQWAVEGGGSQTTKSNSCCRSNKTFRVDTSQPKEQPPYHDVLARCSLGSNFTSVVLSALRQGGIVDFQYSPDDNSMFFKEQPVSNPYYTKDLGPDDYFGYSVESGVFEINGLVLYVGGAPRSKMGYGQVLVFERAIHERDSLNIKEKLRGPQLGAYFGASLCCLDIDGDGAADLLVGAPTFVKKDSGLPYDQGAVFVYMNKQKKPGFSLESCGYVAGSRESGARFGTTIADLGDLDGDGYKDVAIGAPWENEGSGVVYIYRGYDKGLRNQYSQRVIAEGSGSFGISISKGIDVDGNNCNDLAIGAATSSTVYLYRCIPTVLVQTSIKVLDDTNLAHNATGFTALFCVILPKKPQWPHVQIDFNAKIVIDPEGLRATISGDSKFEYRVTATPGHERCDEKNVDVKPTADLSKPMSITFLLEPEEMLKDDTPHFISHAARVSEDSSLKTSILTQLMRDCGEDMICTPWLVMTLDPLDSPFIPGTDTKLGVRVTILNKEEPAYGARVNISLPIIPLRLPSPCSLEDLVMTCDVPAPLFRNEEVVWEIELEYTLNSSSEVNLMIVAELEDSMYSRNISKDCVVQLELDVVPEATFNVTGKALPNATVIISRDKLYDSENITFINYIEIMNLGPSDWFHLEVHFLFDVVTLSSPIDGCEDEGTGIVCVWSVPAKVTLPVVLNLRLNLGVYGEILEKDTSMNTTTAVFLLWKEYEPSVDFFTNTTITTTLVLEPRPPIWPLILGIVAGSLVGILLLALIVYLLKKYGFFSRNQHKRLKELREQRPKNSSYDELESEGAPSEAGGSNSVRELFEDSD